MSEAAKTPLLAASGLRVTAGDRALVSSLTFFARKGELWCVLGANGAGKTLLLHTLAGLRPPEDGDVALAGRPIARWRPDAAARVRGFLPQFNALAFPTRVVDAVLAGRHPHLSRWSWEDEAEIARAREALAAVGLAALAGRDVTTLSGGERQRVAIATLLAQDTPLALLDEPIAHLDLHHQLAVLETLASRARAGRAVVVSIHDLALAYRYATHAILLHGDGEVTAGPAGDVMTDAALGAAFGCPIARVEARGHTLFVAG